MAAGHADTQTGTESLMYRKRRVAPAARKDPPSRPPDGSRPWGKLRNPDPAKHYVYVDPNDQFLGVAYYEALGYEKVIKTEGGVRSVMDTKGDADGLVTSLHQILMSIDKTVKEENDAPGQQEIDELEKRIRGPGGVDGTVRGRGDYLRVKNETSGNRLEQTRAG